MASAPPPTPPPPAKTHPFRTWLAGLLAVVLGAIIPGAISVAFAKIDTFFTIPSAQDDVVAIVTSEASLGNSYYDEIGGPILNLHPSLLRLDQVGDIPKLRPAIVIFGSSNSDPPPITLSSKVKDYLTARAKVVGIGTFGAAVFGQLEPQTPLGLDRIKTIDAGDTSLGPEVGHDIKAGVVDRPFSMLAPQIPSGSASSWAVYDGGDLRGFGFQGIASRPAPIGSCAGTLWTVALHDNDAYWGFATEFYNLSPDGQRLFLNVIDHLNKSNFIQPSNLGGYPGPGIYKERTLTCDAVENDYRIDPVQSGVLDVRVAATSNVVLTITGPDNRPLAEIDTLGTDVAKTLSNVVPGYSWRVTITYKAQKDAPQKVWYGLDIEFRPSGLVPDWLAQLPVSPLAIVWPIVWIVVVVFLVLTHRLDSLLERVTPYLRLPNFLRRKKA